MSMKFDSQFTYILHKNVKKCIIYLSSWQQSVMRKLCFQVFVFLNNLLNGSLNNIKFDTINYPFKKNFMNVELV